MAKKKSKKNFKCNICGRKFESERGLKIHKGKEHKGRKKKKVGEKSGKKSKKKTKENFSTLKIKDRKGIAMDFATKVYEKFDKMIKCVVLFGSSAKNTSVAGSDIDIIIVIDNASIKWDNELITWYREELGNLIRKNPYQKDLHINTVKLTTWWKDLMKGDPVVVNVLRFGEALIDFGGFFNPLKILLQRGYIKSTPEAIYSALERTPAHLSRSRASELGAIEGLYWAMVDSAHAALMAANRTPPSPEHIPSLLKESFADKKMLNMKYVKMYRDLYVLHRKIIHGEIRNLDGSLIDKWQDRAEKFVQVMTDLVKKIVKKK